MVALRRLEEAGLIISERKLEINPQTGKARIYFYRLSLYGEKVSEWVYPHKTQKRELFEIFESGSLKPAFYFFGNISVFVSEI